MEEEEELILQTPDGQKFVIFSLQGWQGFEVGDGDDFAEEVKATASNQALREFLAARRSQGKGVPMADVKKQLELN